LFAFEKKDEILNFKPVTERVEKASQQESISSMILKVPF
jgi:hypothetical protein